MAYSPTRLISALVSASALCAVALPALGQAPADTQADDEVVLDTVEVVGVQNDPAMAAFRAGDFETAEIEFLDNARCALRAERQVVASFDGARNEAARAETLANAGTIDSGANTRGQSAEAGQSFSSGASSGSSVAARNVNREVDRTCEARGRQMYFAGLSQIQLGKTDEALRSFQTATAESKILYDAHYKIGLIKLLDGQTKAAESELDKIENILKRCRDCEARQPIIDRRDHLKKAINGEVTLR